MKLPAAWPADAGVAAVLTKVGMIATRSTARAVRWRTDTARRDPPNRCLMANDRDSPLAPAANAAGPAAARLDIAAVDWDVLCGAVLSRLRTAVFEAEPTMHDPVATSRRNEVLDCVTALEQLRTTLLQEASRRRQLELDVTDLRAELMQVLGEVADARAGNGRARDHGVILPASP